MEQIITVDIGTTSTKSAIFNRKGEIVAAKDLSYKNLPPDLYSEQTPEIWWYALREVLRYLEEYLDVEKIKGIVLSGQMQNLIFLKGNKVITPFIPYYDTRALEEVEEIEKILGYKEIKKTTGNIQDAASIIGKLLWIKKNKRAVYENAETILFGAHDYISWRMTDSKNTDYTTASTTGLLDINKNEWAKRFLAKIKIKSSWLPNLVRADNYDGNLSEKGAEFLGIPPGIPVFHGSGDVGAATIGAGAGEQGNIYCYLGTSGWIATSSSEKSGLVDCENGIYNLRHPEPERLIYVGPMLTAGGAVDWALKEISNFSSTNKGYFLLDETVQDAESGSGGVIFLPYLSGERSPFKDPRARGAFIGISINTLRKDILRSVFEGVAFAMRSIKENIVKDSSVKLKLFLVGGGARSKTWAQIFADVFGCRVIVLGDSQNVGLEGAFAIVQKKFGWDKNYPFLPGETKGDKEFIPIKENNRKYQILYPVFKNLYLQLKNIFSKLAEYRDIGNDSRDGN